MTEEISFEEPCFDEINKTIEDSRAGGVVIRPCDSAVPTVKW
jgi:hypothetical protein